MASHLFRARILHGFGALALASAVVTLESPSVLAAVAYQESAISMISPCPGQNAEVEQAVDRSLGFVYETWMGCQGIAFARSRDGGLHFDAPITVAGSVGSNVNSWDPAVAVAPNGTVYAGFMISKNADWYPVVAASFDHGQTFSQVTYLQPPDHKNWGDRDFIAVGPDGSVYVTWDYGPERTSVTFICAASGSCAFATGDLNVVIQKSTDGGRTFGHLLPVSPGFPASGGDSAPMVIEPNGHIDVLYQGYHITNTTTYAMDPAHSYFTASSDGGNTWSPPVQIGPSNLTMSLDEWWIDGSIAADSAGNLYATWDTQGSEDIGWLSFSTDHGKTWSALQRVTPDHDTAAHIVQVTGGGKGIAYVGWLTNAPAQGYAQYLRPFSIASGWLSDPILVSTQYGAASVWPGDTFGISSLSNSRVAISWGSAVPFNNNQSKSEIFAAALDFSLPK
jgi:BNR/Asp-box repeat